jgi:transforming growth factor-beta-induced protein
MRKVLVIALSFVLVAALAISFVALAQEDEQTIVDIAVEDGRFTTLVAAVEAAGLVDTLNGEGPFTVFAPTDDAFASAFEDLGIAPEDLLADTDLLTDILLYHVVAGEVMAEDVVGLESATTVQGSDISIEAGDQGVFLNVSAEVILTDIEASNGVIHVIDAVILPPAEGDMYGSFAGGKDTIVEIAAGNEDFSTLVAAVTAADLVETLDSDGPFTVFAPTNAAFEAAFEALGIAPEDLLADTETLTDILLYHVVPGRVMAEDVVGLESATTAQGADLSIMVDDMGVYLNESIQVVATDIIGANGVVHVIDGVLLPPAEEEMGMMDMQNIVEIAAGNEDFSTLVAAVTAADLAGALSGEGPFTVFAPTNEAFEAALAALGITAEDLLADTETLTTILLYHVVEGKFMAEDVVGLEAATTLQGADISIMADDMGVFLNDDIQVIATDIEASNGVIHVIDGVLLPPSN